MDFGSDGLSRDCNLKNDSYACDNLLSGQADFSLPPSDNGNVEVHLVVQVTFSGARPRGEDDHTLFHTHYDTIRAGSPSTLKTLCPSFWAPMRSGSRESISTRPVSIVQHPRHQKDPAATTLSLSDPRTAIGIRQSVNRRISHFVATPADLL